MNEPQTERELLELAAKAAGIAFNSTNALSDAMWIPAEERYWNPLADDGDAMRLAVRLRITPHIDSNMTEAEAATQTEGGFFAEPHIDDPYAATRRAIVRAAAAIGAQTERTGSGG
jgi:hypothetical protein